MNATWTEALTIAVPVTGVMLGLGGMGLRQLSVMMQRNHYNAAVVRITLGMANAAGRIATTMSQLPPGSNLAVARETLITGATSELETGLYAQALAVTQMPTSEVKSGIAGALGQNTLHAALVAPTVLTVATPAPATVIVSPPVDVITKDTAP